MRIFKFRIVALGLGLLLAIVAPVIISSVLTLSYFRQSKDLLLKQQTVDELEFLLVIGRKRERTSDLDPTPHRNSRIGIYKREQSQWRLLREPLPVRSNSTIVEKPQFLNLTDAMQRQNGRFGFQSVPYGIFSLTEIKWKDDQRAFLLSDFGRNDGIVSLFKPQEIFNYTVVRDQETSAGWMVKVNEDSVRSSWEKRDATIHPTCTKVWSYGDSHGCINLFHPEKNDDPASKSSEWNVFLSWVDDYFPSSKKSSMSLVIVPYYLIADSENNSLVTSFSNSMLHSNFRKFEGADNN